MTDRKFTIVKTENIQIDLEYDGENVMFHIPYMNKLMFKELKQQVKGLKKFLEMSGYTLAFAVTSEEDKINRILDKLGFTQYFHDEGVIGWVFPLLD